MEGQELGADGWRLKLQTLALAAACLNNRSVFNI